MHDPGSPRRSAWEEAEQRQAQLADHAKRIDEEPLLACFDFTDLSGDAAAIVKNYGDLARRLVLTIPKGIQRTRALSYLVQSQIVAVEASQ